MELKKNQNSVTFMTRNKEEWRRLFEAAPYQRRREEGRTAVVPFEFRLGGLDTFSTGKEQWSEREGGSRGRGATPSTGCVRN